MVKALHAKITFPESESGRKEVILTHIASVEIESGWKMLTDRAKISLPRNVKFFNKNDVKQTFKAGDPVIIELGANGKLVKEFEGYITRVSADIPILIECEDEMWKLKQIPVHTSLEEANLKKLLTTILPGYDIDALDVEIGTQRHPKTTVAKVLKYLQEEYSIYSYFKNGKTLVSGKIYQDDEAVEPISLHLEKDTVSNQLKYRGKEDVRVKVTAISTQPNGDKLEASFGDDDGEERQLSYYNITDKAALEKLAKQDYAKYKVNGFSGTIEIYNTPVIRHGFKVDLTSSIYPDRNGEYYVDHTKVMFNSVPKYHRVLTIGEKV